MAASLFPRTWEVGTEGWKYKAILAYVASCWPCYTFVYHTLLLICFLFLAQAPIIEF